MKTIAFDVMGNDNGPKGALFAINRFAKENPNYQIKVFGDENQIKNYLEKINNVSIVHTEKEIDKYADLRASRNEENSMSLAVKSVANKEADVVISSGSSAHYLAITTLTLKRMQGIKRPAFMPIFPTVVKDKKFVLLDAGANIDTTAEMLEQWAILGSTFYQTFFGVEKPVVKLINIGTEENKGKDFHTEAYSNLKNNTKVNFKGFVEPRDLLENSTDVAVVDGYAGNMILKSMEGSVLSLINLLKKNLKSSLITKIGALLSKKAFKNLSSTLDYRNASSAWVIGLNALALKCHGSADEKSFYTALNQIKITLEKKTFEKMNEVFNEK